MHGPGIRGVLARRQIRPVAGIDMRTQSPAERGFAEDDRMIEALAANRPDDAFHVSGVVSQRRNT